MATGGDLGSVRVAVWITNLLAEAGWVGANVQERLCDCLVDVLQAVSVRIHHETRVVVEENTHAVVTQLVS